jgi:hypothetical protein
MGFAPFGVHAPIESDIAWGSPERARVAVATRPGSDISRSNSIATDFRSPRRQGVTSLSLGE